MQNSGLDPTLLMVLSILALVIILVVLVVCAVVAFRYHFVVVVGVTVVVDGVVHPRPGDHLGCPCCLCCGCVQVFLCHDPHIPPITMMLFIKLLGAVIWREK